jgi:hypothetical protein
MASAEAAAGSLAFPEGRVEWRRPYRGWFILVCILTTLLCAAMIWNWHQDFHLEPNPIERGVSITASPGFLSISPQILDGDTLEVISNSSGPVDIVVNAEDGHALSAYSGLMPGEPCYLEYQEPCTVNASAS